jgi:hypothetical protein
VARSLKRFGRGEPAIYVAFDRGNGDLATTTFEEGFYFSLPDKAVDRFAAAIQHNRCTIDAGDERVSV